MNPNGPLTERLLIIGTAVDGPLNTPRRVNNSNEVERIFGPARYGKGFLDPNTGTESGEPNGASIPLAVAQAMAAGCTEIYCVRATGSYAMSASAYSNQLDIRAVNPGRLYNSVVFTTSVTSTGASGFLTYTITQPAIKGGSVSTTLASGRTIGEMIQHVNGNPDNRTIYINPDTYGSVLNNNAVLLGNGSVTLSGGTNGTRAKGEDYATSVVEYANMLVDEDSGTFDVLTGMNFPFDIAVLADIYIDDQVTDDSALKYTTSIAKDYASWLDRHSYDVRPCHGVIAVRPHGIRDRSALITYVNNNLLATSYAAYNSTLRWLAAGPFLYNGFLRPDPITGVADIGSKLSVVAGPDVVITHPDVGNYTTQIHVLYAAMSTTIPPERSAQNIKLNGITAYGTPIPGKYAKQLVEGVGFDPDNEISGKGAYVVLIPNVNEPNSPWIVYDDPTAASRDDYLRQHQISHLCNSIHSDLARALWSFLGTATDLNTLASMEATTQNILDGYSKAGAFIGGRGQGYDFRLSMDGYDQALGVVRVNLEINPARALRKIKLVIDVRNV